MDEQDSRHPAPSVGPIVWLKSPNAAIYIAYFMSSWGDRMWHFAVGLYLVIFDGGDLRLAAVYGFTNGVSILLLGGIIGHWVDINTRLKVVRVALPLQNICVALSAVLICFLLGYEDFFHDSVNLHSRNILEALVICSAILASLFSVAYKVAIEKDWIVVVSGGDKAHLANLNARIRAVDLACKALAPLVVAQVMTFASRLQGAVFIAVWNLVSLGIEYSLLMRVYRLVPRLEFKEAKIQEQNNDTTVEKTPQESDAGGKSLEEDLDPENKKHLLENNKANGLKIDEDVDDELTVEQRRVMVETDVLTPSKAVPPQPKKKRHRCVELFLGPFLLLIDGWSLYVRHRVCFAGVALGCLFMTVLGFDSITVGYMYSQGISESILGVCTCLAAVTGIIGTFIYTKFRKCIGLNRTGIFGFTFEVCCLVLAVASIWAPGSPFGVEHPQENNCSTPDSQPFHEESLNISNSPVFSNVSILPSYRRKRGSVDLLSYVATDLILPVPLDKRISDSSSFYVESQRSKRAVQNININTSDSFIPYKVVGDEEQAVESATVPECVTSRGPLTSVVLFLVAIITSRIGLWIADLSVSQTFQESVDECERGTLGGVQSSVNHLLNTIKFLLVIALPNIHTFGILIILSFLFIVLGDAFFIIYVLKYGGGCSEVFYAHKNRKPEVNIIYKPKDPSGNHSKA